MARISTRRQIKRNITILRLVLARICSEKTWFSLRQVATGIDRSVHGTFVPPPARRVLQHLVTEGYVIEDDGRYLVPDEESRVFLDQLTLGSKTSDGYLARFSAEAS